MASAFHMDATHKFPISLATYIQNLIEASWNVMAHTQKPDFVFRRNGREHLNRRGRQFSRLLAAEVYASAVVMLDTPCSEVVWRVLATNCIRQFPLHFPSRASPCAIMFQLESAIYVFYTQTQPNNVAVWQFPGPATNKMRPFYISTAAQNPIWVTRS